MVKKTSVTGERAELCGLLRSVREDAGLDQTSLAKALKKPQSFVSRYEAGHRRLDVLELRAVLRACGTTLPVFVKRLEAALR